MTPTNSQKQDTMSPKGPIDDTALERTDRHDHLVQHHYVRQHLIPDKIANPNHATNRFILTLKVKISKKITQKIPFPSSQVLPHGLPKLEFDWLIEPPPRLGVKEPNFRPFIGAISPHLR